MKRQILALIGVGAISGAAGAVVAHLLTKRAYEELYEQRLEEEVQSAVDFLVYQAKDVEDVVVTTKTDEELADTGEILISDPDPAQDGRERVFPGEEDKPDLAELRRANKAVDYRAIATKEKYVEEELPDIPDDDPDIVVISYDLYMENSTGWEQRTLTYFADDGVLDDQGNYVPDHTDLIGHGPYRFGDTSNDPDVVYIRNKKIEQEFEVLRDPGNAAEFMAQELQTKYSPEQ